MICRADDGAHGGATTANRVRTPAEQEAVAQGFRGHDLKLVAAIPFDNAVPEAEHRGLVPIDDAPRSPAVQAIHDLAGSLREPLS